MNVSLRRALELVKQYRATYKNWYSVLFRLYIGQKDINVKLSNSVSLTLSADEVIKLAGIKIIELNDNMVTFQFLCRTLKIYGWKLGYVGDCFSDYYSRLDPKGKRVLDIGAAIGDSPIFFSIMGAKEVVAVEYNKDSVKAMEYNLKVNNVKIIDAKVVGKKTNNLDEITLDELIKKYGPFDLVKIDCDGCEHEIIPASKLILTIPEIFIEYEYPYSDLVNYLSQKYKVKVEETLNKKLGFIHAWLKG